MQTLISFIAISHDKVELFSGTTAFGTLLGTYSGTLLAFAVPVLSDTALLRFQSDSSVTFSGFTAVVSPF